jgi:serine/threonine protein kinase
MCYDPPAIVMELCSGGSSLAKALEDARGAHSLLQWKQQQKQQQQQQQQQTLPPPQQQQQKLKALQITSGCRHLLAWQTRVELLRQAASVLAFMHRMPLLHNDLRADNMLLHDDKHKGWTLKVIEVMLVSDFGP